MPEGLLLNEVATASTPSAGKARVYLDNSATPNLRMVDDANNNRAIGLGLLMNYSVAPQSPAAASRTYITGSKIDVPVNKLQVGTCFEWVFNMTKTAAGLAASTFDICVGTAGTTADTARVSFAKPAGTAVIDQGTVVIRATVRSIGVAGVMVGNFTMTHNLAATGHMVIPCANVVTISGGFDMTVANLILGVCLTSGAADAITIQMVQAKAWNI